MHGPECSSPGVHVWPRPDEPSSATPRARAGRRKETADGFEQHVGTNHLAHFLLTMRLIPLLLRSAERSSIGSRIVNVSSIMHVFADMRLADLHSRRSYSAAQAYGTSKCAQIMFTRTLREHYRSQPLHVFAVHPGEVLTSIARHVPLLHRLQKLVMPLFLFTQEQGATLGCSCVKSHVRNVCCAPF